MSKIHHDHEPQDLRTRILEAARRLVESGGTEAATTRAVAAAASVQAPAIYRLFGDKEGLLTATAEHAMERYVAAKRAKPAHPDPVEDLRLGWNEHVAFCLSQPGLFAIMSNDPSFARSAAAKAGSDVLVRRIHRLAEKGLLRVSEARALALLQAVSTGVINRLLATPPKERGQEREKGLAELAREAVIDAITGKKAVRGASAVIGAAVALKASLHEVQGLSAGERLLLEELLDRIARG